MTCQDHNQDLLLLAHGELGGARRALLELHLRRCPRCREQKRSYLAMSGLIAREVRSPQMPPWLPPAPAAQAPAETTGPRLGLCIALAVLLAVTGSAAVAWVPRAWWCPSPFLAWRHSHTAPVLTTGPSNAPANAPSPNNPALNPNTIPNSSGCAANLPAGK